MHIYIYIYIYTSIHTHTRIKQVRIVNEGGLPALVTILRGSTIELLEDALITLRNVTVEPESDIHLFQDGAVRISVCMYVCVCVYLCMYHG